MRNSARVTRQGLIEALKVILLDALIVGLIAWNLVPMAAMLQKGELHDFGRFYQSTLAFSQGKGMYAANSATYSEIWGRNFWNLNPPHFHLLLLPTLVLSAVPAFIVWTVVGYCCLVYSLVLIRRELGIQLSWGNTRLTILLSLVLASTSLVFLLGQITFILLPVITLAWIAARNQSWKRCGILLGICASIKPFLLLLMLFLIVRRQFHALAWKLLSMACCYVVGVLVFGLENNLQWLSRLRMVDWTYSYLDASVMSFLTRSLSRSPTGSPLVEAEQAILPLWLGAAVLISLLTAVASFGGHDPSLVDRGFGTTLLASLLISPLGWCYYLWLGVGPQLARAIDWFQSPSSSNRWSRLAFSLAVLCTILPFFILWMPATSWLTLTIGSAYFWGAVGFWISLLLDRDTPAGSVLDP